MGKRKKQTVGYRYYVDQQLVFCHGELDAVNQIYCDSDKKNLWNTVAIQDDTTLAIGDDNLFGGELSGGGFAGTVEVHMGKPNAIRSAYMQAKVGLVSACRGVANIIMQNFYIGTSPYLKTVGINASRVFKNTSGEAQWYSDKAAINYVSDSLNQIVNVNGVNTLIATDNHYVVNSAEVFNAGVALPLVNGRLLALFTPLDVAQGGAYTAYNAWGDTNPTNAWEWNLYLIKKQPILNANGTVSYQYSSNFYGVAKSLPTAHHTAQQAFDMDAPLPFILNYYDAGVTDKNGNTYFSEVRAIIGDLGGTANNVGGVSFRLQALNTNYDMNPAHIIRECLTDPVFGLNGYGVDDDSFKKAADTLYDEGFGISILWDSDSTSIEDFIKLICQHINGVVYRSPRTGLFELSLIRDDYDEDDLPVFNASNVQSVSDVSRAATYNTTNSVIVTYWDKTLRADATVTVTDSALVAVYGDVITTDVTYDGITTADLAARVAQRDLRTASSQLVSCKIVVGVEGESIVPGQVIKLDFPNMGFNMMVMRVIGITYSDTDTNQTTLQLVQDVFSLPETGVITTVVASPPTTDNTARLSPYRKAIEMPYYEAVQRNGQTTVDSELTNNNDLGFALIGASRPNAAHINAEVYIDAGAGFQDSATLDFSPAAHLSLSSSLMQDMDRLTHIVQLESDDAIDESLIGEWCVIDDEIMQLQGIDIDTSGQTLYDFKRGCLDTIPVEHAAGSLVLFMDLNGATDNVDYTQGESINVRVLPRTLREQLPLNAAPTDVIDFDARAIRPYPPANITINGFYYPEVFAPDIAALEINFARRNRIAQTGANMLSYYDSDVTPEDGQTTTLELRDAITDALIAQADNIGGTTHTFHASSNGFVPRMKLIAKSVRDGFDSFQTFEHDFVLHDANSGIGSSGNYDPYFSYVQLLLHGEGTNGSTTFKDSSSFNRTVVNYSGTPWTISTAQARFGNSSMFNNTQSTTAQLECNVPSAFTGNNDLCWEGWFYPTSFPANLAGLISTRGVPSSPTLNNAIFITQSATGLVNLAVYDNTSPTPVQQVNVFSTDAMQLNKWNHVCVQRSGNIWSLHLNGKFQGNATYNLTGASTNPLNIGQGTQGSTARAFIGYIDELRITKGVSRYPISADFDPPSMPFPDKAS